jgi:hypothetical protein
VDFKPLTLPVQRGGILIAEMHFVVAIDLRVRAENMPARLVKARMWLSRKIRA